MRLIMDGDSLPFIQTAAEQARRYGVEFRVVANDSKLPLRGLENAWITVPATPNSADIAILEMLQDGDILLTDDRCLAADCLQCGAVPLRSDGVAHGSAQTVFRRKRRLRAMSADERRRTKKNKKAFVEAASGECIGRIGGRAAGTGADAISVLPSRRRGRKRMPAKKRPPPSPAFRVLSPSHMS